MDFDFMSGMSGHTMQSGGILGTSEYGITCSQLSGIGQSELDGYRGCTAKETLDAFCAAHPGDSAAQRSFANRLKAKYGR